MNKKPKIQAIRQVARSKLFTIESLDLLFANGKTARYERLRGNNAGGGVLVIPVMDDEIFLVREYGAGIDAYELMFPKGKIDAGETPEQAANRELQEEIGFAAGNLRYLKSLSLAPGYLGHKTHVILATDLYPSQLAGDEPEPLEVHRFPMEQMETLVWQGDITEGRTIAAMYLLKILAEHGEI